MKGPAFVAGLLVLYTATAAVSATQVGGQGKAAVAFEVASVKPSNPDDSNPLSALPLILPSCAGCANLGIDIPAGALPQSNAPSLLTALQEQLGLKLELCDLCVLGGSLLVSFVAQSAAKQ